MEWLALLLLVAFIGIGGVLRAMFTVVMGVLVLIGTIALLMTADFSYWHWWALGLFVLFIAMVWDEVRRRDKAAHAPAATASRRQSRPGG
jgi:hypothetical protein